MVNYLKKPNTVLTSHVTFYFIGLSSMIIYPLLDLDTFIFLRYLGITIYDAESMSFLLRRFNLFIGLVICIISLLADQGAECSHWCWLLFISYFITSFYIYALSHNFVFIGKISLLCIFFISLASHGLLISGINLMFSQQQIYLDNNPPSRFYIFGCGCFSTGLIIKLLIKFSGGEVLSDTDNYSTLKLFNRLFILITIISLATSFLLSTFECSDEDDTTESKPPPSLVKSTFIGYIWVFTAAYFSWSLSPMLNNLALIVLHSVKRTESFELEYCQFITSLLVSIFIYYTDYIDMLHTERGYIYNSLYRSLCKMLKYSSFTPLSVDEGHQDVREDFDKLSGTLGVRLFRDVFQWPSVPYGFWTEWEEYDNFDINRILTLISVFTALTNIKDQDPFNYDAYYKLGCTYMTTPQDNYKELKKHKYTLLWLGCSYINKCNTTIEKIEDFFKNCNQTNNCCLNGLTSLKCCKCCPNNCDFKTLNCTGGCCCNKNNGDSSQNYIKNALTGCVEDCNALLYDINTIPELYDSRTVDYDEMMFALEILEELLMRLLVLLIYGRVMDEYLILCKFMKPICDKFSKGCTDFKNCCNQCQGDSNCKDAKCCCTLYCKMAKCLCLLHQSQNKSCKVMKGTSFDNLIDTLPPLSLSRAIFLLASFFCDFMDSDLLYEDATCKCAEEAKKVCNCCCLGDKKCCCIRFNSRIDDILNLILKALEKPIDSDAILANVISVFSTFSSFKYPCNYSDAIYPVDGVPECTSTSDNNTNVLAVFGNIYGQFSKMMFSLIPPGHLKPGSGCEYCINESGLCPCIRELLALMREVCCIIDMITKEIGSNSASVVYIVNYQKTERLQKRLSCCSQKLSDLSSKCIGSSNNCCCCCTSSCNICNFVKNVCSSLCTSVELIKALNQRSKCTIQSLNNSVSGSLTNLNNKNTNLYKSCRGTRLGMLIEPSKLISKMITYYKDSIVGRVPDYMKWQFYLFFYFTFTCLLLIYLGRLLPFIRNVPNKKKFKILIILYSLMEAYYFNSSFGFLSSFGYESSYYVNLAIIIGIILSIICSWLTQWFNYRMFLFEQFIELYNKFRLVFPGSRYRHTPTLFWWIEGFVSFLKMDMLSMYYIITLTKSKDTYNPFNFGFSSKLNVEYNLVESDQHIFTHDECMKNIKNSVFESQIIELKNLLDYRSFYHLHETDDSFLKKPSFKTVKYPIDLLYQGWVLGLGVTELSNRLYHFRELGLKIIEGTVQLEAQNKNYDFESIKKLKTFFEFRYKCLLEAPKQAILDIQQKSPYFLNHEAKKLVKLYEKLYYRRWIIFFNEYQSSSSFSHSSFSSTTTTTQQTTNTTAVFEELDMLMLLETYENWRRNKTKTCDLQFAGNDICKLAISRTGIEFETIAYKLTDVNEILNQFMDLVSTSYTIKDIPPNFQVFKYLSKPFRTGENREVKPILDKISKLIRGHSLGERSSILLDFVGVCKNIEIESEMVYQVRKHEKYLIGEWIRWQGLHMSGDLVNILLEFLLFKDN